MDLAERMQRVTLLLQTLNDPYPTPRIAVVPDAGPAPSRYVPCETCGRRGEVRVRAGWKLCLVCDGQGWKRREDEPAWDAYLEMPLDEAARLPRASAARAPSEDDGYGWERLRRRYDASGSYAAVRRQLRWLQLVEPRRHGLVRSVVVDHEPRALSAEAERELQLGVLALTLRLGKVRVPRWLIEQTDAERRRHDIVALAADGLTPGQIARALGLPKKVVQRRLRQAAA